MLYCSITSYEINIIHILSLRVQKIFQINRFENPQRVNRARALPKRLVKKADSPESRLPTEFNNRALLNAPEEESRIESVSALSAAG